MTLHIYTLKIDGMMCGMCETHINNMIRTNFKIKKVNASHFKNNAVITSKEEIDLDKLKQVFDKSGYRLLDVKHELKEKKGLFSR